MLELKHLSMDEKKWLNKLIEESLRDLSKTYGEKHKEK